MIRVLVNGAKGKMGQATVTAVQASPDIELVASLDTGDSLAEACRLYSPDAAVDFTHPSTVFATTKTLIDHDIRPIVGTTGLSNSELETLQASCKAKQLGGLICPNFAIGAILMMKASQLIAQHMPDCEIIEMHHNKKADAPSGTAIKTAELITAANPLINQTPLDEKERIEGSRGGKCGTIPIHSVRLPGYVAHQEVIFGGIGQTLRIRHDSIDRTSFMPGVILAIKKSMELDHLIYGLETVI